jgi:hypothetical protein
VGAYQYIRPASDRRVRRPQNFPLKEVRKDGEEFKTNELKRQIDALLRKLWLNHKSDEDLLEFIDRHRQSFEAMTAGLFEKGTVSRLAPEVVRQVWLMSPCGERLEDFIVGEISWLEEMTRRGRTYPSLWPLMYTKRILGQITH